MWPIYIDEFSVLALYPTEVKNEIEEIIQSQVKKGSGCIDKAFELEFTSRKGIARVFSRGTL